MKKLVSLILAMTLIVIATGCKGTKKVYGENDLDISVKAGETFTISLDENPTTGYQWAYEISDEGVISPDADEYKDADKGNVVGGGGTRTLSFKGLKSGNATITLKYTRSWEENPTDKILTYNITVK
ncbi:MAG: protease inhibitor I42 family protein [Lachnospiraceae bacterium]|jgi:inhibitor of cysteine peptidase|nr:protease inhibitor I42 family protein [Lachnospiraceae bacterium]